jgi:hypothetical protein
LVQTRQRRAPRHASQKGGGIRPSCGTRATCWRHLAGARKCDVSRCFGRCGGDFAARMERSGMRGPTNGPGLRAAQSGLQRDTVVVLSRSGSGCCGWSRRCRRCPCARHRAH